MTLHDFQLNLSSEDQQMLFSIAARRDISVQDLITEMIHSYCGTFRSEEQQMLWALSCMRDIITSPRISKKESLFESVEGEETESVQEIIYSLQDELKRTKNQFEQWRAEIGIQLHAITLEKTSQQHVSDEKVVENKSSEMVSSKAVKTESTIKNSLDSSTSPDYANQNTISKSHNSSEICYEEREQELLLPVIEAIDYHALTNLVDEKEYSQTEAAVILGVTTKMIRRLAKEGGVPSRKSGRTLFFHGKDIKAYIKANKN